MSPDERILVLERQVERLQAVVKAVRAMERNGRFISAPVRRALAALTPDEVNEVQHG